MTGERFELIECDNARDGFAGSAIDTLTHGADFAIASHSQTRLTIGACAI